jgi:hypothetical protein
MRPQVFNQQADVHFIQTNRSSELDLAKRAFNDRKNEGES